ncbi:hypothetical protein IGI04_029449 [Brassica rapa subsp. trilocularis]|uniref:Uncharacterized protein n=1 Tax=Brassica rapa subsp. trilocularis TaxID=1813537 RepID=A0ABQ7LMV9_BRACM|nr:hypothetical protein IGI04_029449 [Brassica rapa subsp. trilocularis]
MPAFDVSDSNSKPISRPGFEILSLLSGKCYQKFAVKTILQVLKISEDNYYSLLRMYRWCGDHLFEAWFEGILVSSPYLPLPRSTEDNDDDEVYLTLGLIFVAVRGGPSILEKKCPALDCQHNLGLSLIESLASREIATFWRFAALSLVDDNCKIK